MSKCLHHQAIDKGNDTVWCEDCSCYVDWETENYNRQEKLSAVREIWLDSGLDNPIIKKIYNVIEEIGKCEECSQTTNVIYKCWVLGTVEYRCYQCAFENGD